MSSMAPDGAALVRDSRERFLSTGQVPAAGVREEIAASWRRSRMCGVAPDRLDVPYEPDRVNDQSRLCRAAAPVMERFAARLADTPTGLFLADRQARGVRRWVGQPELAERFDAVGAADGFRFDEEVAGTNALGTTIELGRPVKITASEHWVEQLNVLTCAGAPIRNPITRQIEGIVDLTCVNEHNADLLLALVLEIAYQVEERFYAETSISERLMLQHFSSAARNSSRPVMAISQDMILTNPAASRLTRGLDQELLWDLAARVMHADRACTETLNHADRGTVAHCVPVRDGGEVVGVTIELKRGHARSGGRGSAAPGRGLPGLVGRSPAWHGVCQQVRSALEPARPLVVGGETGVGKLAVARAWAGLRGVVACTVVDLAAEVADGADHQLAVIERALLGSPHRGAVIIAHLDRLDPSVAAAAVGGLLERHDGRHPLAVTVTTGQGPASAELESLLDRLGGIRVEIPPLRRRREDVLDLVAHVAGGPAAAGSEVVQLLMRMPWPRNVRELRSVVEAARVAQPAGEIRLDDLPQSIRRGAGRRMLSAMEQAELDTIVAALDDAGGNKVDAAQALGISRSTLYRKIHAYGLDLDRAAF